MLSGGTIATEEMMCIIWETITRTWRFFIYG
jgi:hypothetical protein